MENSEYKVSVIIPVYNSAKYIGKCLDCLLAQTLSPIEIICVLDCPTDGADLIVKEKAATHSNIKVVANTHNLHIGESRNAGLKVATGKYIGFSDDDDFASSEMYEQLYNEAEKLNAPIVRCQYETINIDTNVIRRPETKDYTDYRSCLQRLLMYRVTSAGEVWTHIYRRDFVQQNGLSFIDTKQGSSEDFIFNTMVYSLAFHQGCALGYIAEPFYHYIRHNSNTGATSDYIIKNIYFREHVCKWINTHSELFDKQMLRWAYTGNVAALYEVYKRLRKDKGEDGAKQLIIEKVRSCPNLSKFMKEHKTLFANLPLGRRIWGYKIARDL